MPFVILALLAACTLRWFYAELAYSAHKAMADDYRKWYRRELEVSADYRDKWLSALHRKEP